MIITKPVLEENPFEIHPFEKMTSISNKKVDTAILNHSMTTKLIYRLYGQEVHRITITSLSIGVLELSRIGHKFI